MSVQTLHASQVAAGQAIGLDALTIEDILEAQRPRIIELGELPIEMDDGGVRLIRAARGISGPDNGYMDKGGSRMTNQNFEGDLEVLPQDMLIKLLAAGITDPDGNMVNGGKLLFDVDPSSLTHDEKKRVFAAAARAMLDAERAGHNKSVPAGDMGTNHSDYMDMYANEVRRRGHDHWQASITGKSVKMGGLEFRPHATGYGVYLAALHQRDNLGLSDTPTRITFSGAGNVGGYAAYYASRDPQHRLSVGGFSDTSGTLYIANEDPSVGINVDENVLAMMDNPNFSRDERYKQYKGNKLAALAAYLEKHQPELDVRFHAEPNFIMQVPTGIFVPASVRNLINGHTAPTLSARGITEAGNDTIDSLGYEILAQRGIEVIPGIIANAGGVATSMDEHRAGITGQTLTFEQAKDLATQSATVRLNRMQQMAKLLETDDYNLAASALAMSRIAKEFGHRHLDASTLALVA